jgi:molybdenum cofactor cytidylyltransferase
MKFRRVPLAHAEGHILGHNVSHEGRRVLRKGGRLLAQEIALLARSGQSSVYVAELEPDDVNEDVAAQRVAAALQAPGSGLECKPLGTGRVALRARSLGVVELTAELVIELNSIAGVTLATQPRYTVAARGALVGTLKIIPFALPVALVEQAEAIARRGPLAVIPLASKRVRIVVSGSPGQEGKLLPAYRASLERRLTALGSSDVVSEFVALGDEPEEQLGSAVKRALDAGAELVIVAGETATMDQDDLAAVAIQRAGGGVTAFGAPVFPGNLLLLGYRGLQAILGAPGCARGHARNVVDLILPRLLLGERLGPREIAQLGPGGLIGGGSDAVEAADVTSDAGHD